MKKYNPLMILLISIFLYWIILFIVAYIVDYHHSGGEQYFLTIIAKGIQIFPITGIVLSGFIGLIYKEWAIKNRIFLVSLILFLLFGYVFILSFNH